MKRRIYILIFIVTIIFSAGCQKKEMSNNFSTPAPEATQEIYPNNISNNNFIEQTTEQNRTQINTPQSIIDKSTNAKKVLNGETVENRTSNYPTNTPSQIAKTLSPIINSTPGDIINTNTPVPIQTIPPDWIEPVFEVLRGEAGGYYRIRIKNKADYAGTKYEMKSECVSHPFNQALRYNSDWKRVIVDYSNWNLIDSNIFLTFLCKADYCLPEYEKDNPIYIGMKVSYIFSIRNNGFIKQYPFTVTVE